MIGLVDKYKKGKNISIGDNKAIVASDLMKFKEFYAIYVDIIENIKCPIAFAAGENDPIVFPRHTRKLYEKTAAPKDFKLFKKGLHAEDLFTDNKEEFMKYCTNFLKQL